ncbi:TonB-dependent receptor [Spirosoma sp. BT702]|uniref:TonB-dependent receptor n=1 Tax=Spirosoma profusum TaxID=2771354 RepID=A0A926Y246_9BACT|nr:TonB-dependent receptor [Spirosoma profusum]MBD2700506.1 TonB-dependent receptor [Spirosoma profusum]
MRTSVSLMLIVLVASLTYGRDGLAQDLLKRSVTVEAEQRDLKTILNQLEKSAKVRFSYTPSLIRDRKVSLTMHNQPLEDVLVKLLRPLRIQYAVSGGYIILNREPSPTDTNQSGHATSSSTDMAAVDMDKPVDRSVSGNVTDEKGQGLPGVNVVIKGTTRGTTSNADGSYRLNVPEGAASTLVFSLVGYTTQEIIVGTRTTLDIQLQPDNKTLNEVVVVGYGTQKKSDLTGSIASVNSAIIGRSSTTDATGALQGNVPGVVVVKNVGKPGSGYSINVRGTSSFGGSNSPLFVIDGIPTTSGLNDINPADIDKIDVLKDASATAIYGSRGAKGVVIVTTKRGKSGKTTISYDGYVGSRVPIHLPDMMDGPDYVAFRTQLFQAQGRDISRTNTAFFTPEQWANIDAGKFTDWPSLFLKNGLQMNHNLSASGGDDKTRFSLGAGFLQEDGNVSPESFKRYSFRGNVDRQISEKWKAGINFYISQDLQNQGSYEALRSAYRLPPTVSPYDNNGTPVFRVLGGDGVINPLFDRDNDIRMNRYFRAFGNIYVQLQPTQGLTLKSTFSPNYYTTRTAWFIGGLSKEGAGAGGYNKATYDNSEQLNWRWDNQAIYEADFGGVHKITATLVQSMQLERLESSGADVFNLPYNSLWYNLGSATNTTTAGVYSGPTVRSNFSLYTLTELIGRVNYSYKDKYLLTVSGTYDGSSHLAAGNQYGFFPSAAIKWRLGQENFMKTFTPVNDLSFRLSYGASGNDRIDPYTTQATLGSSVTYFGSALAQGYSPNRLANKDLTWETTQEINLGLDFSLFNNRLYGSIDVYNRDIRNILVDKNLPAPAGFNSIKANLGRLRNRGIEVGLSTINIEKGKFSWKTDYVFDANKNQIRETANGAKDDVGSLFFIGQPVQVNYDYVFDGIWQTSEADLAAKYNQKPGQVRVKDINNDGVINASDRQIIGKRVPSWTGSIGNTFRYGNLDLYVLVYSRQGEQYSSSFDASFMNYNQIYKQMNVDYWTPTNPSTTHFQPGNPGSFVNAIYYRKSDFVRVNNITLGYTFPRELLQKVNINSLRLYATATNPFLFTKYDGFDPEWTSQNTYGTAISTATYLFGVNLSF